MAGHFGCSVDILIVTVSVGAGCWDIIDSDFDLGLGHTRVEHIRRDRLKEEVGTALNKRIVGESWVEAGDSVCNIIWGLNGALGHVAWVVVKLDIELPVILPIPTLIVIGCVLRNAIETNNRSCQK